MTDRGIGPVSSSLLAMSTELTTAIDLPPATVARLLRVAAMMEAGGRAKNTVRAMRSDLATWHQWCRAHGERALPARPDSIARFIHSFRPHPTDRTMAGGKGSARKPATVRRYVASISAVHRAAAWSDPTKDEEVRLALRAVASAWADRGESRQRQAIALTTDDIGRILSVLDDARLIDKRDRALLLTAHDLLARRAELTDLRVEDMHKRSDGTTTIRIRRSKTDQAAEGVEGFLLPGTVSAIEAWLDAAQLRGTKGELFRSVTNRGTIGRALHPQKVPTIFKKLVKRAALDHIDVTLVSGHSCRVGMAQDMIAASASVAEVMQAGRWRSPTMVSRYTERLVASRGAVARLHDVLSPKPPR
jgi:site-specific recombinase XerD